MNDQLRAWKFGRAFLGEQLDQPPEPCRATIGCRDENQLGQQGQEELVVGPLKREAASQRHEVRLAILLAMPNGLTARSDRLAKHAVSAAERERRCSGQKKKVAPRQPTRFASIDRQPSFACKDDREAWRVKGIITHAPSAFGRNRLRDRRAWSQQQDDVAQGIHFGRSIINLRHTIMDRPKRFVYLFGIPVQETSK